MKKSISIVVALMMMLAVGGTAFCAGAQEEALSQAIPPGTVITPQNWQQYSKYMTAGMQALFSGKYFWKVPANFQLVVSAPFNYQFPKLFIENTEKYAKNIKIINLPNGGHNITGYVAGLPFPNPTDPLRGWKLLVDDWYTYQPHLICAPQSDVYEEDRFGNRSFIHQVWVIRRFAHNSDSGVPIDDSRAKGIDLVEYTQILAPEEIKYTTVLTIYYDNMAKPEDLFLFIPALRRSLRVSSAARCSPFVGTDYIYDDTRHGNFNGNATEFDADYLGEHEVLLDPRINNAAAALNNLNNYYLPLFFPKPTLTKWDLRKTWKINVHPTPAYMKGYCISKRILYIDEQSYSSSVADRYDMSGKLWKTSFGGDALVKTPGIGQVWTNGGTATIWDLQNEHLSWVSLPFLANQDCDNINGNNYNNIGHYSSLSALAQILR
ncbi:MAG: DUF1329 domain-containing protein [Candidatus Binataceae bacterium]